MVLCFDLRRNKKLTLAPVQRSTAYSDRKASIGSRYAAFLAG
jgi:hypothetical protein